jgi:hypothetical protein
LARKPPRFYGAFPFRVEDIGRQRTARGAWGYNLFDCHSLWKPFFRLS